MPWVEFGAKLSMLQLVNAQCSLEKNLLNLCFMFYFYIALHSVFYLMVPFSSAVAISWYLHRLAEY